MKNKGKKGKKEIKEYEYTNICLQTKDIWEKLTNAKNQITELQMENFYLQKNKLNKSNTPKRERIFFLIDN